MALGGTGASSLRGAEGSAKRADLQHEVALLKISEADIGIASHLPAKVRCLTHMQRYAFDVAMPRLAIASGPADHDVAKKYHSTLDSILLS